MKTKTLFSFIVCLLLVAATLAVPPPPTTEDPSTSSPAPRFYGLTVTGPTAFTNNAIVGGFTIGDSNTFQVDTPQLAKAFQVDSNGNSYLGGNLTVSGGPSGFGGNVTFTNGSAFVPAAWSGPTNSIDMDAPRQTYTASTNMSVTNLSHVSLSKEAVLWITNSTINDLTLYLPRAWRTPDGSSQYVVTNRSISKLSVDTTLGTNAVFTSYWAQAAGGGGLLNSLYAVYEMEQNDATDATDATGGGHTLTHTGATALSTTHIEGSRANHGGTSAYWSINNTAFNTNGDFSFYAWANNPNDGDYIVNRYGGTGQNSWALYFDGVGTFSGGANHYKVFVRNAADNANFVASSTITVSGAGWHMIGVNWNSGTKIMKISVDNETLVATATTDGLNSSTQNFRLGQGAVLIDENAVWNNRILTQGDIGILYNSGSGLFYSGGGWTN